MLQRRAAYSTLASVALYLVALYLIACLSIPIPTSKIERLNPVFCRLRLLPFLALRVIFLIWSFSDQRKTAMGLPNAPQVEEIPEITEIDGEGGALFPQLVQSPC